MPRTIGKIKKQFNKIVFLDYLGYFYSTFFSKNNQGYSANGSFSAAAYSVYFLK